MLRKFEPLHRYVGTTRLKNRQMFHIIIHRLELKYVLNVLILHFKLKVPGNDLGTQKPKTG